MSEEYFNVSANSSLRIHHSALFPDFTRRLRSELQRASAWPGLQRSSRTARPLWQLPFAYFSPSQPFQVCSIVGRLCRSEVVLSTRLYSQDTTICANGLDVSCAVSWADRSTFDRL